MYNFESVQVLDSGGPRFLRRNEWLALPSVHRIQYILSQRVRSYRAGKRVPSLHAFRRAMNPEGGAPDLCRFRGELGTGWMNRTGAGRRAA